MFIGCSSLISFPDISISNESQITKTGNLFEGCISSINLPPLKEKNNLKK